MGSYRNRCYYPVPGFAGDPRPRLRKFDLWYKRPEAAQRLYWRLHPVLYKSMLEKLT